MQQKAMRIEKIEHRGEKRIAIFLPYNHEKTYKVKAIEGRRWSATCKCWHVADTIENINKLYTIFNDISDLKIWKGNNQNRKFVNIDYKNKIFELSEKTIKQIEQFKL